ncbi:MAG: AAC(3) family N-acetyltransferase [Bacteroidales bacterium]|nr:AAC(3) family N-acetyltransferase [Bacteroidales bacterium]
MKFKNLVQQKLIELESNTILIHSDIMQGFNIPYKNRETFPLSHLNELHSLKTNLIFWMPSFNYDFCKGQPFDIKKTPSQVGALTEYFRKNVAHWRTHVPVFSFSGIGEYPAISIADIIDPFGNESAFHILYNKNALLMHYGSLINTTTILHYAERRSGCLSYRYDKLFVGKVITNNNDELEVKFNFHVRPFGKYIDYDWKKIKNELIENKILFEFKEESCRILLCKIQDLIDYWVNRMKQDPFYLLDNISKAWIEPLVNKLGRSFLITDFEPFLTV